MKTYYLIVLVTIVLLGCSEDTYQPVDFNSNIPTLDLEQEASTIPWEYVTGKIIYRNEITNDIVLIDVTLKN